MVLQLEENVLRAGDRGLWRNKYGCFVKDIGEYGAVVYFDSYDVSLTVDKNEITPLRKEIEEMVITEVSTGVEVVAQDFVCTEKCVDAVTSLEQEYSIYCKYSCGYITTGNNKHQAMGQHYVKKHGDLSRNETSRRKKLLREEMKREMAECAARPSMTGTISHMVTRPDLVIGDDDGLEANEHDQVITKASLEPSFVAPLSLSFDPSDGLSITDEHSTEQKNRNDMIIDGNGNVIVDTGDTNISIYWRAKYHGVMEVLALLMKNQRE